MNNDKIFDCYCLSLERLTVKRKSSESRFRKGEQRISNHNKKVAEWRGTTPGARGLRFRSPFPPSGATNNALAIFVTGDAVRTSARVK